MLFQTRLVGLDADWSAPTASSTKEYPFLQDGHYRFEARVVSPTGLTSETATWSFRVLPPWWRTGWAYAGYAVAAGLLLVGADRIRASAMRRRTRWLEAQVRLRTAELEKANAAKTEFIARVNHDIRNPINGVLGLTLTLEQTPLNEEQRRMAGTIKQCARFLSSLVEEVLDFAEIESGTIKIKSEPFALREALAASVATVEPLAQSAQCRLSIDMDDTLPAQVSGDSPRVQQILVNFLTNAVKFGAGRPVTVSATPLHQVGPSIVVRLAVRDEGPGLAPEEQQQLFRKFSRGRYAEERKIKGTGLGLAVCHLLAESLGGRVGVVSELGRGAEFFLEVPLTLSTGPDAIRAAEVVARDARVLVVEDEDYNAISLVAMLERMGFQVDRCADGITALEMLSRHRYEIVFLDWELPRLNGIEVARRFRRDEPRDRRTLLIATTAYASAAQRQACRAAGMDEFVAKPLTPERIVEAIRGHSEVLGPASSIQVREEALVPPSAGPYDLSLFAFLAEDAETVEAKIEEYVAACDSEVSELSSLAASGSAEDLRRAAHRFLSQCRFVGAARLAELALQLEQTPDQPGSAAVRELAASIREEFEKFRIELRSVPGARPEAVSDPSRSQSE